MLIYIISLYLFFAVILALFFTTYVFLKSRFNYTKVLACLCFCISFYLFGYLMELNSATLGQMVFWNQIQYLALPFFPALWLMVTLLYIKKSFIFPKWFLVLLFTIPVLTFFFRLTNSFHHLYYSSMELKQAFELQLLHLGKGPWYYVQNAYLLFLLFTTTLLLYWQYRNSKHPDRLQFSILLAAVAVLFIGLTLILFDFMGVGIDYGALIMPVTLLLIIFATFKYGFLELKSLAREAMFENNSDAMILLDNDYRIMDYNKAAKEFFSSINNSLNTPQNAKRRSKNSTAPKAANTAKALNLLNRSLEDVMGNNKELTEILKNGSSQDYYFNQDWQERFFEISSTIMHDNYGRNVGTLKSVRDITEKKKMQEKLKIMATVDQLSGLYNRGHFMELAKKEFERSKRYNLPFSVLMMDLDHFKSINDTVGHAGGDAVIREIGKMMKKHFRRTDILGRLGGEEFSVILLNTPIDEALLAAEKFRKQVASSEVRYENTSIKMTISIGVTSFFSQADNFDQILKYADIAMYESKARGRNRTTVVGTGGQEPCPT